MCPHTGAPSGQPNRESHLRQHGQPACHSIQRRWKACQGVWVADVCVPSSLRCSYYQHVLLSCCLHCCLTFGIHIREGKRPQPPCPSSNLQSRAHLPLDVHRTKDSEWALDSCKHHLGGPLLVPRSMSWSSPAWGLYVRSTRLFRPRSTPSLWRC